MNALLLHLSSIPEIEKLLRKGKCVGLGEVGLDYTTHCKCLPTCINRKKCRLNSILAQKQFLMDVLPLALKNGKIIVLHCRDYGDGKAARDTLEILKHLKLTGVPVHRHCFLGNTSEMQEWESSLSIVYFGVTPLVLKNRSLQETVKAIDVKRILLESDSPYLGPKNTTNTPWELLETAKMVATLKNMPLEALLKRVLRNTSNLYRHSLCTKKNVTNYVSFSFQGNH